MAKYLNPDLCTHVELISFFEVDADYNVHLRSNFAEEFHSVSNLFKPKKTPLILTLGKYDDFSGSHYSNMTSDETNRHKFVAGVMAAISKYQLGGFFAHWQHPVKADGKRRPEEFKTYPILMKLLSEKLKEKNLVLYAVAPVSYPDFVSSFDNKKLKDFVDLWFIPAFHYEGGWSKFTGIASPVKRVVKSISFLTNYRDSCCHFLKTEIVDIYSATVTKQKVVFGIPTGMSPSTLKDPQQTKLNSPTSSSSDNFHNFKAFCNEVAKGGVNVVHNETGQVNSYAYRDLEWVSYDSSYVILSKTELAKRKGIAGVYLAFLGEDDIDGRACQCGKFYMLRTINEGLRGDGSCLPQICP